MYVLTNRNNSLILSNKKFCANFNSCVLFCTIICALFRLLKVKATFKSRPKVHSTDNTESMRMLPQCWLIKIDEFSTHFRSNFRSNFRWKNFRKKFYWLKRMFSVWLHLLAEKPKNTLSSFKGQKTTQLLSFTNVRWWPTSLPQS